MKIFKTRADISNYLRDLESQNKTIGLVPTMGVLHQGHMSLINIAKTQSDVVVCSIFVNPTQFNDPKDLDKYPRPIEDDIKKIEAVCDVLFSPSVDEMYKPGEKWQIELEELEHVLEGKFRPGHYQGVTQIVKKLFDIIKPDKAFFGQKDFQQFKVIEKMTKLLKIPVELIMCPIVRNPEGLAMSSRNIHLSAKEQHNALSLYRTLLVTRENLPSKTISELIADAIAMLNNSTGIKLEYFEIRDRDHIEMPGSDLSAGLIALVAAWVGNTRLIDNIILR